MIDSRIFHLPISLGYQDLDQSSWKRYYLFDAEQKARNSTLLSQEVSLNRLGKPSAHLPIVASWPLVSAEDLGSVIDKQLSLARRASLEFQKVPLPVRIQILREFGRQLIEKMEFWRQMMVQESYAYNAFLGSFDSVTEIFKPSYLNMMEGLLSPSYKAGTYARLEYVPQGVIGVISPQNSSFPMLTQILHAAILTANAVIIKPPHRLAIVALAIAHEFNQFLQELGMPNGLISTITHANTQRVMEHWLGLQGGTDRIDNLIFIGNSKRRDSILETCQRGSVFNPIIELEGVDAAYVHEDLSYGELKHVAKLIAYAKNMAAGQMCVSLKRLYVQRRVYDKFMEFLRQEFQKYRPGSLLEDDLYVLGPSSLAHKLSGFIQAFERHGAYVSQGGRRLNYQGQPDPEGLYIEPTLIEGVSPDNPLLQEEIFANLLPVVKVQGTVEEAIAHINRCPYGLRASIFSHDAEVIEQMQRQLRVGTLVVNGNPHDFSLQIAGGRGRTTLDQNARIWPLDMSLRRVVTGGKDITTVQSMTDRGDSGLGDQRTRLSEFPKIPSLRV